MAVTNNISAQQSGNIFLLGAQGATDDGSSFSNMVRDMHEMAMQGIEQLMGIIMQVLQILGLTSG